MAPEKKPVGTVTIAQPHRRESVMTRPALTTMIALPMTVLLSIAACESNTAPEDPEFDLSFHSVPLDEILSGGPPKDGIPAILEPAFVSASDAAFLDESDRVIGFAAGDEARAYPLRILNWHEVVNDVIDDRSVAVTYCPLTGSGVIFDRRVGGEIRSFGVSGRLYNSNVLMYDRQSESLWSQLGAQAVTGDQIGAKLKILPSKSTTWEAWRTEHPGTMVLSLETGFARDYSDNPYRNYEESQALPMFVKNHTDVRLRPKDKVLGVTIGDTSRAYPLERLRRRGRALEDSIEATKLTISVNEPGGESDVTGAVAASVSSDAGPINGVVAYWFAWALFHPDTEVWEPEAPVASAAAADSVTLSDVESYWTGLSGFAASAMGADGLNKKGLYVIRGFVNNTSEHPLHHVRLRFDLLGQGGRVVYYEEGFNRVAEPLLDARRYGGDRPYEEIEIESIAPGERDSFRMAFIAEEVPQFSTHRVVVLEAE